MKVISIAGSKGGSGKTMVAHLLAHGLSRGYGLPVTLLMTDRREGEQPLHSVENREYFISSVSRKSDQADLAALQRVVTATEAWENSVLVIDGGANRQNVDTVNTIHSDLVLVPVGTSAEDISVAETDYWKLADLVMKKGLETEVYMVRNKWPGSKQRREVLLEKPWVKRFMLQSLKGGILFPDYIPDLPSLLDMANSDDPKTTPLIDSVSARFAELVGLKVGIELPERRKLGGQQPQPEASEDEEKSGAAGGGAGAEYEGPMVVRRTGT